jgi:acyl carrier protein
MEFDRNDTLEKVIIIVTEQLHINRESINQLSEFSELGADSLDMVEIILKLEETFCMQINEEDAEHLTTIDQVVDYIHARRTK